MSPEPHRTGRTCGSNLICASATPSRSCPSRLPALKPASVATRTNVRCQSETNKKKQQQTFQLVLNRCKFHSEYIICKWPVRHAHLSPRSAGPARIRHKPVIPLWLWMFPARCSGVSPTRQLLSRSGRGNVSTRKFGALTRNRSASFPGQ